MKSFVKYFFIAIISVSCNKPSTESKTSQNTQTPMVGPAFLFASCEISSVGNTIKFDVYAKVATSGNTIDSEGFVLTFLGTDTTMLLPAPIEFKDKDMSILNTEVRLDMLGIRFQVDIPSGANQKATVIGGNKKDEAVCSSGKAWDSILQKKKEQVQ